MNYVIALFIGIELGQIQSGKIFGLYISFTQIYFALAFLLGIYYLKLIYY